MRYNVATLVKRGNEYGEGVKVTIIIIYTTGEMRCIR